MKEIWLCWGIVSVFISYTETDFINKTDKIHIQTILQLNESPVVGDFCIETAPRKQVYLMRDTTEECGCVFTLGLSEIFTHKVQHRYHFCSTTLMKLPTMFVQELKWIRSSKSRPRVCGLRTQSRELGDKSQREEKKIMWPYTAKFNRHAKGSLSPRRRHAQRCSEVRTFTPVPHQSRRGVFNFPTADLCAAAPHITGRVIFWL